MEPAELLALAVNRISFLRPREKMALHEACQSVNRFLRFPQRDLEAVSKRSLPLSEWRPEVYLAQAEQDRKRLTRGEFQCTFYWNRDFPPQLREIFDPPLLLYYRGRLPGWDRPLVAVVGTRHPTGAARERSYALAFQLARVGITTVSGLARGIDAEAHRGSLDAGGSTIAVLGNGVDILFPYSSRAVARRLLTGGGALVSEYPPESPPLASNFPARNRIISGLGRSVVVIQAPLSSGALITADYALEQGRDLLVHSVGLEGAAAAGSRGLAQDGAQVIEGAAELFACWGWREQVPDVETRPEPTSGSLATGRQLARLMELELQGRIVLRGGKVFQRGTDGK